MAGVAQHRRCGALQCKRAKPPLLLVPCASEAMRGTVVLPRRNQFAPAACSVEERRDDGRAAAVKLPTRLVRTHVTAAAVVALFRRLPFAPGASRPGEARGSTIHAAGMSPGHRLSDNNAIVTLQSKFIFGCLKNCSFCKKVAYRLPKSWRRSRSIPCVTLTGKQPAVRPELGVVTVTPTFQPLHHVCDIVDVRA